MLLCVRLLLLMLLLLRAVVGHGCSVVAADRRASAAGD
jgi:hypothetical protein